MKVQEKYDLEKYLELKIFKICDALLTGKTNIKATYSRILFVLKRNTYSYIIYYLETAQKTLRVLSWLSLSGGIHTIFMFSL